MTSKPKDFISGLLVFLVLFNVIDALFTVVWLSLGIPEANPIMARFSQSPVVFVLLKMTVVCWGSLILWFHREKKLASYGVYGLSCFYFGVTVLHVWLSWLFITKVMT